MNRLTFGKNSKRCSVCNELKLFSEFYKRNNGKFGYRADCKICYRLDSKGNKLLVEALDHINLENEEGIEFWERIWDYLVEIGLKN